MDFKYNDGGREAAGFLPRTASDCVTRAIAIAMDRPYREVWEELADRQQHYVMTSRARYAREARRDGGRKLDRAISPDHGVMKEVSRDYLLATGWSWTPTMSIGAGTTVHLRAHELPRGRLIVSTSRHYVAVIDGVVHDTHDPTRDGKRCVYGYFRQP